MKTCLEVSRVDLAMVKKIFIHQANEKMDAALIRAFYKLPTLFDMVRKGTLPEHSVQAGDIILFASVGAGMNINAVAYRV